VDILNIKKLKEILSEYVKIKFELFKLDITEHLSKILAQVIAYMIIFFMAMFVFAYAGIALANYLNQFFENTFGGYLVVAGIFLLLLFIVAYFLRSGKLKSFLETKIVGGNSEEPTEQNKT